MRLGTMALISSCFRRFPMRLRMSKCVVDLYIARCSLPSALLTFFLLSFSHSLSVPLSLAERAAHRHIYRDAQRTRLRREGKDVDTAPLGVRSKRSRGVRVPRAPRWPRAANRRNASPQHAARRVEEAGAFAWRSAATRVVVACARRSTPSPLSPLPRPLSPLPPPPNAPGARHGTLLRGGVGRAAKQPGRTRRVVSVSFMYRYTLRESCSQFDSLYLTSLTIPSTHTGTCA